MGSSAINPTTMWTPQGGYGNYGATTTTGGGGAPVSPYQTGVTSGYLDSGGNQQQAPTNPYQFATPQAAQTLAQRYGGTAIGDQLAGPGNGWSSPQQLIGINGMQGALNAGLVANTLGKYGSDPGSYGEFEIQRDIAQNSGQAFNDNYNAWATSQPGWKPNPNLANSGPGYNMVPDGKGGYYNAAGMPAPPVGGPQGTPTSFTGANGLTTTGIMNPYGAPAGGGGVPAGKTPGQGGTMINGQWSDYQPPAGGGGGAQPNAVGQKMLGQNGTSFTWNGTTWSPDASGGQGTGPGQPPPGKVMGRDGTMLNGQWVDYATPGGGGDDPRGDKTTSQQTPVGTRMNGQDGSEFEWDGTTWQPASSQGGQGATTPRAVPQVPRRLGGQNPAITGAENYEGGQNQTYRADAYGGYGQGGGQRQGGNSTYGNGTYQGDSNAPTNTLSGGGGSSAPGGNLSGNTIGGGGGYKPSNGYGDYGGNTRTSGVTPYPGAPTGGYPSSTLGPSSAMYKGGSGGKYLSY